MVCDVNEGPKCIDFVTMEEMIRKLQNKPRIVKTAGQFNTVSVMLKFHGVKITGG